MDTKDCSAVFTQQGRGHPPELFAREILENPYHWTRAEGNGSTVRRDADGQWLLVPRDSPFYPLRPQDDRPPEDVICEGRTRFGAYLDEFHLWPSMITICRSDHSGYPPRDLVRQIEAGVRELSDSGPRTRSIL